MKSLLFIIIALCSLWTASAQHDSFLFRTPLSFYNTDILSYLQVLHKNQQYEKMVPFFTGPIVEAQTSSELEELLSDAPFGYSMKRSGIRETASNQRWSLTYTRTILGTQETFKIDCVLERDTCRLVLDDKSIKAIFKQ